MITGVVQTKMTNAVQIVVKKPTCVKITKYWDKRRNKKILKNNIVLNFRDLLVRVRSKLGVKLLALNKGKSRTLLHK
jgi:hypothetical protein